MTIEYEIERYTEIVITILGIIGNIIMFMVFFEKNLRKLTFSIYFQALAISGVYMNINWSLPYAEQFFLEFHKSEVLCKLFPFLERFATTTSSSVY